MNSTGIYSGTGCDALLFAQTGKESSDRGSPDVEVHFFSSAPEEEQLRNGLDQNIKDEVLLYKLEIVRSITNQKENRGDFFFATVYMSVKARI